MFDPTAFDNMKVVIEGALYDLEFIGEIAITDRNDMMNMAKMARRFDISFSLSEKQENPVLGKIEMESHLSNLAAELLPEALKSHEEGCLVTLAFVMDHPLEDEMYVKIQEILEDVWGKTRIIQQSVRFDPFGEKKKVRNIITVGFNRLIREEQIDDLVEMIDFMIATIKKLQVFQI